MSDKTMPHIVTVHLLVMARHAQDADDIVSVELEPLKGKRIHQWAFAFDGDDGAEAYGPHDFATLDATSALSSVSRVSPSRVRAAYKAAVVTKKVTS